MVRVELGDLGTWLAGLGTVGAFFLAFSQLEAERKRQRQVQYEGQAKSISAWVAREGIGTAQGDDGPIAWVAISNSSNEPVHEVVATIVKFPHGGGKDSLNDGKNVPLEFRAFISVVPPGVSYARVSGGYRGMHFQPAVEIAFKDKNGKYWVRGKNGGTFEIHKDPVIHYGFSHPMSWVLPVAEITGSSLR
jgi:hypothetical protein